MSWREFNAIYRTVTKTDGFSNSPINCPKTLVLNIHAFSKNNFQKKLSFFSKRPNFIKKKFFQIFSKKNEKFVKNLWKIFFSKFFFNLFLHTNFPQFFSTKISFKKILSKNFFVHFFSQKLNWECQYIDEYWFLLPDNAKPQPPTLTLTQKYLF